MGWLEMSPLLLKAMRTMMKRMKKKMRKAARHWCRCCRTKQVCGVAVVGDEWKDKFETLSSSHRSLAAVAVVFE